MRVSVEGSRFALERRLRQGEDWKAIAASDNEVVMNKLFTDQKPYVKHGELRLLDRTTGRIVGHWHRPDLPLPQTVEARDQEPATVVEVTRRGA